jgi:murein L,D-transpeptidase YcbB/YkuD
MQSRGLNPNQAKFLSLYLGRDEQFFGNATKCYARVYKASERQAQVGGSRLLKHELIAQAIDESLAQAAEQSNVDTEFIMRQSIRLYDICMGDLSVPVEYHVKNKDTGELEPRTKFVRHFKPSIARQTLEMLGRLRSVNAFNETIEHTHTHYLEQRLAQRSKLIEAQAVPILEEIDRDPRPGPGSNDKRGSINGSRPQADQQ